MEELSELLLLQMQNGGRAKLTVTGYSMMPMLHNGRDAVELILPDGLCKKGDVILYRREDGRYILHRIISAKGETYICCGDNQAEKEMVSHSQVLARMDGFFRKGKHYALTCGNYCFYKTLWVGGFPLRRFYISIRRRLGRMRRRRK